MQCDLIISNPSSPGAVKDYSPEENVKNLLEKQEKEKLKKQSEDKKWSKKKPSKGDSAGLPTINEEHAREYLELAERAYSSVSVTG
jgi:hypothetical protein